MFRSKLVTREIYHIYNRGVEKREVFLSDKDRLRFIHDLFEFNDQNPNQNLNFYFKNHSNMEIGFRYFSNKKKEPRKLLVEILSFCLMPNHFHLMVRQLVDGGVTKFMRKMGVGYTNYFNEKYERVGSLFQGKYKYSLIKNNSHFVHLPYYIHLNPLDIKFPDWRNRKLKNLNEVEKFLNRYRWSSHLDYCGEKNFPSITQRDFLLDFFEGPNNYKHRVFQWLKDDIDMESLKNVFLE